MREELKRLVTACWSQHGHKVSVDLELFHLLETLYQKTGCDFREYRTSTLTRRLSRRLHATGAGGYRDYHQLLEKSNEERHALIKDLTIRVTEFFREPESWKVVAGRVVPNLLARGTHDTRPFDKAQGRRMTHDGIKIWSAGCATGEEAYSLAMVFEENRTSHSMPPTSILGTDLDKGSISLARGGVYRKEKLKGVSPHLLGKYFLSIDEDSYQVHPRIKELVNCQPADLIHGKAPEEFDLICCQNVLIYFSKKLQEKILVKFYHALRPGGFLWLGKAESLWGNAQELFETVDKKGRIFRKHVFKGGFMKEVFQTERVYPGGVR